jgi:hypothetical protein
VPEKPKKKPPVVAVKAEPQTIDDGHADPPPPRRAPRDPALDYSSLPQSATQ